MLVRLAIRDIVLIDQLDLEFSAGLSILTGETGAGKSILLDALSLALGARGDGALVRHGQAQGQVTAAFELSADHPALAFARERNVETDGELILRRVQMADGRTRAFVNDQPVSAQMIRAVSGGLVEIHGQHDERALMDAATHRALVDAYGALEAMVQATRAAFGALKAVEAELAAEFGARRGGPGRRGLCRPRPSGTDQAGGRPRRGGGAGRAAVANDAGREGLGRHSRRP